MCIPTKSNGKQVSHSPHPVSDVPHMPKMSQAHERQACWELTGVIMQGCYHRGCPLGAHLSDHGMTIGRGLVSADGRFNISPTTSEPDSVACARTRLWDLGKTLANSNDYSVVASVMTATTRLWPCRFDLIGISIKKIEAALHGRTDMSGTSG